MSDEEIALELVKLKFKKNYDDRNDRYYEQRIIETYKRYLRGIKDANREESE